MANLQEIWKDIAEYNGLYQVSNLGQVYSTRNKSILKPSMRGLYKCVTLSVDGKNNKYSIHRLVAAAFCPNPQRKPCVNHINGDKVDNQSSNLEWCTYSENERHSFDVLGKKVAHSEETKEKMHTKAAGRAMLDAVRASAISRKGIPLSERTKLRISKSLLGLNVKAIIMADSSGILIKEFPSVRAAVNETGIKQSAISNTLTNRSKTAGGYTWQYK